MANGYMPRRDVEALAWFVAFADGLGRRPGVFGVSPRQVEAVRAAVGRFAAAYPLAVEPVTRTMVTVAAKDTARREADLACRPVYAQVKADPGVADADKVSVGVRLVVTTRSRVGPPTTSPALRLVSLEPWGHELAFGESRSVRRAKPRGVTHVQLYRRLEGGGVGDDGWDFVGCFTRGPVRVEYWPADHGRTAVYRSRWMNGRGETGPWGRELEAFVVASSRPVRNGEAGGGVGAAAAA